MHLVRVVKRRALLRGFTFLFLPQFPRDHGVVRRGLCVGASSSRGSHPPRRSRPRASRTRRGHRDRTKASARGRPSAAGRSSRARSPRCARNGPSDRCGPSIASVGGDGRRAVVETASATPSVISRISRMRLLTFTRRALLRATTLPLLRGVSSSGSSVTGVQDAADPEPVRHGWKSVRVSPSVRHNNTASAISFRCQAR